MSYAMHFSNAVKNLGHAVKKKSLYVLDAKIRGFQKEATTFLRSLC